VCGWLKGQAESKPKGGNTMNKLPKALHNMKPEDIRALSLADLVKKFQDGEAPKVEDLQAAFQGDLTPVAAALGLVDDRVDLPPAPQFAFQFFLSLIALSTLLWLERFTLPLFGTVRLHDYSWGALVYVPLTVLWVMGMINTVNWLDGLDGLAAGVGAILCLVLAVHMRFLADEPQASVALLPLALMGALVGFLPYNVAPARVFLGSTGAFFLGYALAGLGLIAGGRTATVLMVMGLPIVDVAWQIFDRLRRRRSPVEGDRGHLHYRLLDMGLSKRWIVLLYWCFCALFGVLALVAAPWQKLIALLSIAVIVVLVLVSLSREG